MKSPGLIVALALLAIVCCVPQWAAACGVAAVQQQLVAQPIVAAYAAPIVQQPIVQQLAVQQYAAPQQLVAQQVAYAPVQAVVVPPVQTVIQKQVVRGHGALRIFRPVRQKVVTKTIVR